MDFSLVIRQRLQELGTEQRALAAAGQVTESYLSQLLTGKKAPPAPGRSDIYDRLETFLRLPAGHLATLADVERKNALKRKLADPPAPLAGGRSDLPPSIEPVLMRELDSLTRYPKSHQGDVESRSLLVGL